MVKNTGKSVKKSFFKTHKHLRWLLPLLLVTFILVLAKHSYFPNPQSDISSNEELSIIQRDMNKYENLRYHYSLSYPKDMTIEVGTIGLINGDTELPTASSIKITSSSLPEEKFTAWIASGKNQQYPSLEDFATSLQTTKPGSMKMTKLDGTDALRYITPQPGAGEVLNIVALRNGYYYQLSLDFSNSENIPLFNQLVSVFKFTD